MPTIDNILKRCSENLTLEIDFSLQIPTAGTPYI
ncbi:Uncharacterised protein [Moraxella caprae]|uniref:Uncharacterized protein n=1 Tax=Moraxella caprae TaxID=90240 RepID=A0A378R354_9GAMM|nr:Uncharacterised protein [Moraxella caprae]